MKIDSVLILAAGKGTRLKPYTDTLPKSLLPLGETNILCNLIMQTQEYFPGVKIFINTSYLAEQIIEEITNFPISRRPNVIWEPEPLGPAFTVTNHCNETNGNVLVIHGDNFFSDLAYSEFANSVKQKSQDVSILLCHQRAKNLARSLVIQKDGVIQSILEISAPRLINDIEQHKSELVWTSSGALVIKKLSLMSFNPEIGESLSPKLINFIADKGVLILEKCVRDRISIDSESSYLTAVEINKKNQKLFNRALRH